MNHFVHFFKWFYERLPIFSHIAFICFLFWVFYPVEETQDEKSTVSVKTEEFEVNSTDFILNPTYESVLQANSTTRSADQGESTSSNQDDIISSTINSVKKEVRIQSVVPEEETVRLGTAEVEAVPVLSTDVLSQYKSVEVVATGYSPTFESTGKNPDHPEFGITYSGVKVLRDPISISTIAADLSVFPLGTVLYVPGYGYGVVSDIGSAIKGNKIDLYYDTKEHVYDQWGKKQLEVYIVEQGDGEMSEKTLNELMIKYKE